VPSLLLLALALAAAHVVYSYLPRERAETPPPLPLVAAVQPAEAAEATQAATGTVPAPGWGGAEVPPAAAVEPLRLLATGPYDVCVWVPYPHQNLGALAGAIGDLQDVVAAAARLSSGERPPAGKEPEEPPTFGPFEVPPASELTACSDLAGGRLRVVARIYPLLAAVAKVAGRLADNPWLAGGEAGRARIVWDGRLWSVTEGEDEPPAPAPPAAESLLASPSSSTLPGPRESMVPGGAAPAPAPPAAPVPPPARFVQLPESLAVVRWSGARPEIPAGYYALTRSGSDLALSLAGTAVGAGSVPVTPAPRAALLVAVGPEWPGGSPLGGSRSLSREAVSAAGVAPQPAAGDAPLPVGPSTPAPLAAAAPVPQAAAASRLASGTAPPPASSASGPLPPAALALFETGGSHLSSLGDLPGLAVFNRPGPSGTERWSLPTSGLFRLLARRLPAADLAGWRIVALDPGSLRQAEAVAPRLAALPGRLSLGVWLDPRSALRIVSRIRRFVEGFPLASRGQVQLWRDWETVLDPLANCDRATLAATASPPSMRLLLQGCTSTLPSR
jgi:hypothetical protein